MDDRRFRRTAARRAAAPVAALAFALGGLAMAATELPAQEQERWTDWVYQPGSWVGGQLVPADGAADPDSLALVATVDAYVRGPRWRAEVRRVEGGRELAEPVVLVAREDEIRVLTPLGATAFGEHAASEDPIVRAVAAGFDEAGRSRHAVRDSRFDVADPGGGTGWVAVRTVAARAEFADALLEWGTARRLGREALRFGMHAIGGERSEEVVATIGARGVAEVRTVDGVIEVMPDTAAVRSIQRDVPTIVELDRFIREGRLGAAAPPQTPRREDDR